MGYLKEVNYWFIKRSVASMMSTWCFFKSLGGMFEESLHIAEMCVMLSYEDLSIRSNVLELSFMCYSYF